MAFTSTRGRYATFETITSIPGEVIDAFWFIIDNHLKGVFMLNPVINFDLLNSSGQLSIKYSQTGSPTSVIIDFDYPYNPNWNPHYHAIDDMGKETIMTQNEI